MTNSRKYYIPKGSEFLEKVEATTPGAVRIDYQLSDGTAGHYFAFKKEYLRGVIESIYFKTGQFGKSLMINLINGEEKTAIQATAGKDYATTLMHLIPSLDLKKEVIFAPYDFTPKAEAGKKPKRRRGVSLKQDDEKVKKFFFDSETRKALHGAPEFDGDPDDKADWTLHFMKVNNFLVKYITANFATEQEETKGYGNKLDDFDSKVTEAVNDAKEASDDSINPEDIPF